MTSNALDLKDTLDYQDDVELDDEPVRVTRSRKKRKEKNKTRSLRRN